MATEDLAVDTYITERVLATPALTSFIGTRVFAKQAPEKSQTPFLVFSLSTAVDRRGNGGRRHYTECEYVIKIVSDLKQGAGLPAAAAALDDLFDQGRVDLVVGNVRVMGSHRVQPLGFFETHDNRQVEHCGGIYRFNAHRA